MGAPRSQKVSWKGLLRSPVPRHADSAQAHFADRRPVNASCNVRPGPVQKRLLTPSRSDLRGYRGDLGWRRRACRLPSRLHGPLLYPAVARGRSYGPRGDTTRATAWSHCFSIGPEVFPIDPQASPVNATRQTASANATANCLRVQVQELSCLLRARPALARVVRWRRHSLLSFGLHGHSQQLSFTRNDADNTSVFSCWKRLPVRAMGANDRAHATAELRRNRSGTAAEP
jgi:hypothetical protein